MSETLPAPFRYCLTCGRICMVSNDLSITKSGGILVSNEYHYKDAHFLAEVFETCYGPFATSTPPADRPINWDSFDVPDAEELAVMNENALSLLADFQEMENVVR